MLVTITTMVVPIIILVFHVVLQESCHFKGRNPSRQVTILPSFVVIDPVVAKI